MYDTRQAHDHRLPPAGQNAPDFGFSIGICYQESFRCEMGVARFAVIPFSYIYCFFLIVFSIGDYLIFSSSVKVYSVNSVLLRDGTCLLSLMVLGVQGFSRRANPAKVL